MRNVCLQVDGYSESGTLLANPLDDFSGHHTVRVWAAAELEIVDYDQDHDRSWVEQVLDIPDDLVQAIEAGDPIAVQWLNRKA